jgi:uncharacterized protein (TIGR02118 family)
VQDRRRTPDEPPRSVHRDEATAVAAESERSLSVAGMTIKVSVFYPKSDGATFDHDYYKNSHVPLCVKTWGLEGAQIEKGLNGPYEAAVHFTFDSLDALGAAMGGPGTAEIMADVANYTDITPVMQTSEIVE